MSIFRRFSGRYRVERLIRDGVGVHEARWDLAAGEVTPALRDSIIGWARQAMGAMRRPYGIDHVAVALACRDEEGRVVCSNSLGVVRPAAFYGDEAQDRVEAFLDDLDAIPQARRREVVGALLSLGDLAYEMGLTKAA
jgi:hypothetical protein